MRVNCHEAAALPIRKHSFVSRIATTRHWFVPNHCLFWTADSMNREQGGIFTHSFLWRPCSFVGRQSRMNDMSLLVEPQRSVAGSSPPPPLILACGSDFSLPPALTPRTASEMSEKLTSQCFDGVVLSLCISSHAFSDEGEEPMRADTRLVQESVIQSSLARALFRNALYMGKTGACISFYVW